MKKLLYIILVTLVQSISFAQVPPFPDQGENSSSGPGAPASTPIDSYFLILLFLGFAIGAYFIVRYAIRNKELSN